MTAENETSRERVEKLMRQLTAEFEVLALENESLRQKEPQGPLHNDDWSTADEGTVSALPHTACLAPSPFPPDTSDGLPLKVGDTSERWAASIVAKEETEQSAERQESGQEHTSDSNNSNPGAGRHATTDASQQAVPADAGGKLQAQFNRLDQDQQGILSPENCYEVIERFVQNPDNPSRERNGHSRHTDRIKRAFNTKWKAQADQVSLEDISKALEHLSTWYGSAHSARSETAHNCEKDQERNSLLQEPVIGMDFNCFRRFMAGGSKRFMAGMRMLPPVNDQPLESTNLIHTISALQSAFEKEEEHYFLEETKHAVEAREMARNRKANGLIGVLLEVVPAVVILVNAVVMGLQADIAPTSSVWDVFEIFFLFFYVSEAITKVVLFGAKDYLCGYDRYWNWFDILCILLSVTDVVINSLSDLDISQLLTMKLLRLVRLVRLVKALQYPIFDELKAIIQGVFAGLRVLGWALVSLAFIVFFLGVILNKLMDDEDELATVPASMFTVFRCVTDGCAAYNGTPFQAHLRLRYGAVFTLTYALVFMFVTFGLFNLIMATFIDNVVTNSFKRKQKDIGKSMEEVRQRIEKTFTRLILLRSPGTRKKHSQQKGLTELRKKLKLSDSDQNISFEDLPDEIHIPREVFNQWLHDREVVDMLESADIDIANKFELFDVLDVDMGGVLELDELIEGLMKLRGPITKSDIAAVRLKVRYMTSRVDTIYSKVLGADPKNDSRGPAIEDVFFDNI